MLTTSETEWKCYCCGERLTEAGNCQNCEASIGDGDALKALTLYFAQLEGLDGQDARTKAKINVHLDRIPWVPNSDKDLSRVAQIALEWAREQGELQNISPKELLEIKANYGSA
jgi:hypothetical protein